MDDTKQEDEIPQDLGADEWRARMAIYADVLLKVPTTRKLEPEEIDLFISTSTALAKMFQVMDEKLRSGYLPPRAWMKDQPEPGQLPSSDLHRTLKAESELIVLKMVERLEKRVAPKDSLTAKTLMQQLGKLLSTLALFTSESVRLACLNNLKPEAQNTAPHLALVHDADPTKENN